MNFQLVLAACVVLVAVNTAVAGKGGPGGARKEPTRPTPGTPVTHEAHDCAEEHGSKSEKHGDDEVAGDKYYWNRVLSDSVVALESATVQSNSSVIIVRSKDQILRSLNISKAETVYDFSNSSKVEVIRAEGACYVLESALSYQEIVDQLNARNNTNITGSDSVALNGTLPALTKEDAQAFIQQYPNLRKRCHECRIIRTTPDVVVSSDTRIINVFTLNARVSITVGLLPPPPPTTPKGLLVVLRGGKSGERKGH